MARPGEDDVDFSFEFPEQDHPGGQQTAARAGGASAFGSVAPRGRETAAAPPDMHDEFDALPDSPTSFGQDPTIHRDDDSFDDVGVETGSPTAFGDAEHVDGAPRIYADGEHDDHLASGDEPIENFGDEGAVDLDVDGGEHAHTIEDDENVLRHAGRHDDEEHGLDNAPVAAQRSLLSRLIMPIGGIAMLGAVGYGAWSYVSPVLFGQPAVQTAQGTQRIQMPPTTTMPNGLPAGSPATQRPPMPQETQLRPAPQAVQRPAPAAPAPSMLQPQQPPPAAQPVQVASAVPEGMTGMNRPPQGQADDALRGIAAQLDTIGTNIGRVNSRLEVLERAAQADRSDFSGRIAALENKGPAPAAKVPAPTSSPIMPSAAPAEAKPTPAKETRAPSLVSEPKKARAAVAKAESVDEDAPPRARRVGKSLGRGRHVKSDTAEAGDPGDVAMAGDEPPAKPVRIPGLRLKAVSEINGRSMVSVQTSKGRTEEFTVGQSIPGAGEIRSIRQNGGSWVVVTSRGVIVE
jgi:hypothetical protein